MLTTNQINKFLKKFGYKGDEFLMHPVSGCVVSARLWACDCDEWDTTEKSVEEQFSTLIHVKNFHGDWVAV